VGKGEGHGYGLTDNNIRLFEGMLQFLENAFPK
jgi:hypothetical protein